MAQTSTPPQDDQDLPDVSLPEPDEVALPAGDDVPALPDGYEVVLTEETVSNQVADAEAFGETLVALQSLIQRHSVRFDELNETMKQLRDSLRNLFDNDEELQKLEAQAKTITTDAKAKKQKVKDSPEAVQFQMKIKEIKDEMDELHQTMNNHLLRYFQMTGSQVIEQSDGTEREFSVNARLKKAKAQAA